MGSLLRTVWVLVSVWVITTFLWWMFMPLVDALLDNMAIYATSAENAWVHSTMRFSWAWFPIIMMFVCIIWAVWAATRPDIETAERYYGYR